MHHAGATSRQDQLDIRMMHKLIREFDCGLINPSDYVFGRTGILRLLQAPRGPLCRYIYGHAGAG